MEQYNNNKKCSKCDNKQDGTTVQATAPKVTTSIPKVTPLPPEQVDSTKPVPTYKELIPYLEEIAKYKQTDNQVLTPTNSQREIIKKIEIGRIPPQQEITIDVPDEYQLWRPAYYYLPFLTTKISMPPQRKSPGRKLRNNLDESSYTPVPRHCFSLALAQRFYW